MQRALILLGILAAAGLLAWQFTGEQARRAAREDRPAIEALPPDEEVSITVETAELRGIVKDAQGQPIADVQVEVPLGSEEPPMRAETGEDGRFRLDLPEQPWVMVQLRHAEYIALETWGQLDHDNEFMLERGAPLTVLVLDSEGEPVAGAVVSTTHTSVEGARGIWNWSDTEELGRGKTGADGRFVVGAVPLTPFDLFVRHERFAAHTEQLELLSLQPTEHVVRLGHGGVVEGTVYAPDGEPVEGAQVKAGLRSGTTDGGGRYRIEQVAVGFVKLRASKEEFGPGFFGQQLGWDKPVPVEILPGEVTAGLDIQLGEPTWITGSVIDQEGKPIPEAMVSVWIRGGYGNQREFTAGPDGTFRAGPFSVVRRGRASLHVTADGFQRRSGAQRSIFVGEELDFGSIKLTRSIVVRGRCVDLDGSAVARARIQLEPRWQSMTADADGNFEVSGVPTGKVIVSARHRDIASPNAELEITGDVEDLVLTLEPTKTIRGRVTDSKGAPRPNVTMFARTALRSIQWLGTTDETGRYEIGGLARGRYEVGVGGYGQSYMWGGPVDLKPKEVEAGANEVDFVFPFTGGIVTATLVSKRTGLPIPAFHYATIGYRAFIPSVDDFGDSTNRDGLFRFEFKNEGNWSLEFSAEGHAPYRTAKLKLSKGEKRDLGTIRLGEGGVIEGRVVDAQGLPVPYTRINILSPKLETNDEEPFTGRDGSFRIQGISPGMYMVFAVSPRHPVGMTKGVLVREAQTTQVEVKFAASAPLEVVLKQEDGQPLTGAKLFWSFPEIAPLNSKLVGNRIPPGYGDNESNAEGRIFQHALPAGPVTLFLEKNGFTPVTRQVQLKPGKRTRVEITMSPKK